MTKNRHHNNVFSDKIELAISQEFPRLNHKPQISSQLLPTHLLPQHLLEKPKTEKKNENAEHKKSGTPLHQKIMSIVNSTKAPIDDNQMVKLNGSVLNSNVDHSVNVTSHFGYKQKRSEFGLTLFVAGAIAVYFVIRNKGFK